MPPGVVAVERKLFFFFWTMLGRKKIENCTDGKLIYIQWYIHDGCSATPGERVLLNFYISEARWISLKFVFCIVCVCHIPFFFLFVTIDPTQLSARGIVFTMFFHPCISMGFNAFLSGNFSTYSWCPALQNSLKPQNISIYFICIFIVFFFVYNFSKNFFFFNFYYVVKKSQQGLITRLWTRKIIIAGQSVD